MEQSGLDHGPISVHEKMRDLGMTPVPSTAALARIFRDANVARAEPRKKLRCIRRNIDVRRVMAMASDHVVNRSVHDTRRPRTTSDSCLPGRHLRTLKARRPFTHGRLTHLDSSRIGAIAPLLHLGPACSAGRPVLAGVPVAFVGAGTQLVQIAAPGQQPGQPTGGRTAGVADTLRRSTAVKCGLSFLLPGCLQSRLSRSRARSARR